MPFQTVETVNERAQDRQHTFDLFSVGRPADWRNRWAVSSYLDCFGIRLKPATFDELVSALQAGGPMFIVD